MSEGGCIESAVAIFRSDEEADRESLQVLQACHPAVRSWHWQGLCQGQWRSHPLESPANTQYRIKRCICRGLQARWRETSPGAISRQATAVLHPLLDGSGRHRPRRSEEHTSELQSLMRISYAVFC